MLNQCIKDSAIYGIGRFCVILFGFIAIPILTHHLSATEYGTFDLLVLCVALLNISIALEVSQAVARFVGEAETPKERALYTSTALFFSICMYLLISILIFTFHLDISKMLFGTEEKGILVLLLIPWFIFHGVDYFLTNQLRWENRALPYIILKMVNAVLLLLAIIWFVQQSKMGVTGVVYAYILSLALTAIIGISLLIHYRSIDICFCKMKLKEMLLFSLPLVPSSGAVFIQNYIDRIMIVNMLDLQSLGLYSFVFKIASALTLVSTTFQMSVTPLIYQFYKNKDTPSQIAKSLNVYLFCVFAVMIGLCLFIPELFHFFIGKEFHLGAYLIPILSFSVILASVNIFAPGIVIVKKTKLLAIINIVGMAINIILNFIFIRHFGLVGAAFSTVASLAMVMFITFFISSKYYPIPYLYKRIIVSVITTIILLSSIHIYQQTQMDGELIFSLQVFLVKLLIYPIILLSYLVILLLQRDSNAKLKLGFLTTDESKL